MPVMPRLGAIPFFLLLLALAPGASAQDDDAPLGDIARAARASKPSSDQSVIDNDNLSVMMDQAESERLNGKPVFSIDSSSNAFRMTSPDGTCSLSFDAKATSLISTPFVTSELPQDELVRLDGAAAIHDTVLEVSLHNGSEWGLKEIVVGITVPQTFPAPAFKSASLAADSISSQKLPDLTMLYHLKADSAPDATTVFRGDLGNDVDSSRDWRWSLVSARGIPPAAPGSVTQAQAAVSSQAAPDASTQVQMRNREMETYPAGVPYGNAQAPAPVNAPPPGLSTPH